MIYDERSIDLNLLRPVKEVDRARLSCYAEQRPGTVYTPVENKYPLALPGGVYRLEAVFSFRIGNIRRRADHTVFFIHWESTTMQLLSPAGQQIVNDLAQRYNFSPAVVISLLEAVLQGQGSMAQFSHPELGGSGQWMAGGMIMLSDMFNHTLKSRVDGLCSELAALIRNQPDWTLSGSVQIQDQGDGSETNDTACQQRQSGSDQVSLFIAPVSGSSSNWWGADLRWPTSTGTQNGVRYAYFAQARRLAIGINNQVTIYDTLDHHIGGFSQQQGYGGSLTFSSQYGLVEIERLPVLSVDGQAPWSSVVNMAMDPPPSSPVYESVRSSENDLFALIERLADLHARGILSTEEFAAKKAELLSRI